MTRVRTYKKYYNKFEPEHKAEMDKKKEMMNKARSKAKKIKKAKITAPVNA